MMRNATLSIVLLAGCCFCFVSASRGLSATASNEFKPVASVDALMHGQGMMFKQLRKAIQNKSMDDRGEAIEHYAEVLAELSNVNTLNKNAEDYQNWARSLRDTALEIAEVGEKDSPDEARLVKLVRQIKNTCQSCHDKYQED